MRTFIVALAAVLLACTPSPAPAEAVTPNYGDYTKMFERSAGQFYSGGSVAGQWSWSPQSTTESHITWGHPDTWPKGQKERFIRADDWVLLDGWWGNGTYYRQDVQQWQADPDCKTNRVRLPDGAQRYARWDVPAEGTGYCLFAVGTLTEQSSGKTVMFAHQQVWTNVGQCPDNPYRNATQCLRQTETWWDDNKASWGERLHRDVYLAKGHGMAYRIDNRNTAAHSTVTSTTQLRYQWAW